MSHSDPDFSLNTNYAILNRDRLVAIPILLESQVCPIIIQHTLLVFDSL